jgi:hypothetical protein
MNTFRENVHQIKYRAYHKELGYLIQYDDDIKWQFRTLEIKTVIYSVKCMHVLFSSLIFIYLMTLIILDAQYKL